jgi:hypothetical protein
MELTIIIFISVAVVLYGIFDLFSYDPKVEHMESLADRKRDSVNYEMTLLHQEMKQWFRDLPYGTRITYKSEAKIDEVESMVRRFRWKGRTLENKREIIEDFKEEFQSELLSHRREKRLKKLLNKK